MKFELLSRATACTFLALWGLAYAVQISPARAFDETWYKADFWGGEYPEGFTLKEDFETKIRATPDLKAERSINCALKKGETYHPWNEARVEASNLEFVTFVRKVIYVINKPVTLVLHNEILAEKEKVVFDADDEWIYLTYYAEGSFRMQFNGGVYTAEQSLFDASTEKGVIGANSAHEIFEWMKLTCANGATGWLLYDDVFELPQFEKPQFPEYGKAVDRH